MKAKTTWKVGALTNHQFRWFYTGRMVSLFGNAMTPIALTFAVLQVSHGQHLLGYILTSQIIPHILMLLIGGTVADVIDGINLFSSVILAQELPKQASLSLFYLGLTRNGYSR